ncbi:MAG: pyruvate kinase [Candidatus Krumholzibacteria bacterium]|nr:pyruvate kinase [Candidatus Krumholzibacteria bacterium]
MLRRAKIICTIGPASRDKATLKNLVEAGMNVARINFSHGSHEEHLEVVKRIREISGTVAIMQDLQGPKIRVGELGEEGVVLTTGSETVLATVDGSGSDGVIPVTYASLPDDVVPGDNIFLNDGLIHLAVKGVRDRDVTCEVIHGGLLTSRKGVNLPGVRISSPALTEKDRADLDFGLDIGVDYVALSFVRSPEEVLEIQGIIRRADSAARVIAKIEKQEALDCIDSILEVTDGIMIARGDLGVEIPAEKVPIVQKELINACLKRGKPVITATQMLESMVSSKRPTRAEASDVANAVIDGTDAVMLSAETATGRYPVETVDVMGRIIEKAEEFNRGRRKKSNGDEVISSDGDILFTDAICSGAAAVARDIDATAIAVLTHGGHTARLISRRRPDVPVLALTDFLPVVRQMALVWGVRGIAVECIEETEAIFAIVKDMVKKAGFSGKVVVTAGIPTRQRRPSNTVHVIDI